jgi:hypothetical protein
LKARRGSTASCASWLDENASALSTPDSPASPQRADPTRGSDRNDVTVASGQQFQDNTLRIAKPFHAVRRVNHLRSALDGAIDRGLVAMFDFRSTCLHIHL